MATVIYGQPDTRFGELGKALGGLAGSAAEGIAIQQASQGVSQIMQDPTVAESDKPLEVMKKFGPIGYQIFNQQLSTKAKQATITGELAKAGLAAAQQKRLEAGLPYVAPEAAAQIESTKAGTAQKTAQATQLIPAEAAKTQAITSQLIPAQAAETTAAAGQKYEAIPLTRAEAQKTGAEAELLQTQLDQVRKLGINQLTPDQLGGMLGNVPDDVKQVAIGAYNAEPNPLKKMQAMQKELSGYVQSKTRGAAAAARPDEAGTKAAETSIEHATSAQRYVDTFAAGGAEKIGTLAGAPLKAFLERHGIPTGDTDVLNMWNAAYQQVASTATSGGGFFANGRVKLASDVTPTISETPLHAIIAADQVADRELARLKVRQQDHPEQKSLQTAIDAWTKVKQNTGSLNAYTVKAPDGSDKSVVNYNGSEVDPKTFKVLVGGNQTYKDPKGATASGADIIAKARQYGMDPADMLARFQGQQ